MSNNQLPADVQNSIEKSAIDYCVENKVASPINAIKAAYIAGAIEYGIAQKVSVPLTQERANLIREVNNRDLGGIGYYRHADIQDLKAKGEKLAMELRRLKMSMEVHPDYFTGANIEFIDRVESAEEALAEWSGEKEVKL